MDGLAIRGRVTPAAATYVAVSVVLAILAFVWPVSHVAFWALFLLTLPASLVAYFVTYAGGVLVFGVGDWSVVAGIVIASVWTAVAAAQAWTIMSICRARRVEADA